MFVYGNYVHTLNRDRWTEKNAIKSGNRVRNQSKYLIFLMDFVIGISFSYKRFVIYIFGGGALRQLNETTIKMNLKKLQRN